MMLPFSHKSWSLATRAGRWLAPQLPDVALHVVARDHPQGAVMDEDAGRVPGPPGRARHLVPVDAIGRVPDIVAVGLVVAFQYPQPPVEDGHLVILPRLPGRELDVPLPAHPIRGTPDVVVELAR